MQFFSQSKRSVRQSRRSSLCFLCLLWACSLLAAAVQARDRLGLRFLTNRAGVGLDAFFFSRGLSSHDTVIPSVVFFGREIESAAQITAGGAVDFGAPSSLQVGSMTRMAAR